MTNGHSKYSFSLLLLHFSICHLSSFDLSQLREKFDQLRARVLKSV